MRQYRPLNCKGGSAQHNAPSNKLQIIQFEQSVTDLSQNGLSQNGYGQTKPWRAPPKKSRGSTTRAIKAANRLAAAEQLTDALKRRATDLAPESGKNATLRFQELAERVGKNVASPRRRLSTHAKSINTRLTQPTPTPTPTPSPTHTTTHTSTNTMVMSVPCRCVPRLAVNRCFFPKPLDTFPPRQRTA